MVDDKRFFVTGGAGFLGSNLCKRLLRDPEAIVVAFDNLSTGSAKNIESVMVDSETRGRFAFYNGDITEMESLLDLLNMMRRQFGRDFNFDVIANLACPASPPKYQELAVETLMAGSIGIKNLIDFARMNDEAYLFHTSTSEVYGDPQVHPQPESYFGNVNPVGQRSMYDESKRFSEALLMASKYPKFGMVRIFNTYGPHMDLDDGRMVPTFIKQAMKGDLITIHGIGKQTRSICYVDDLISGFLEFISRRERGPMNLGTEDEITVVDLALEINHLCGDRSKLIFVERPKDDPEVRRPVLDLAFQNLPFWKSAPRVSMKDGLRKTISYFSLHNPERMI